MVATLGSDGGCIWRRPQDLTLSSTSTSVTAAWSPPASRSEPIFNQYVVQWRAAADSYSTTNQVVVLNRFNPSYTIENLSAGTTYFVRVAAVHSDSPSTFSDNAGFDRTTEESITLGRATAPGMLGVVSGDGSLSVSWSAPGDGGGAVVSGYGVQWRSSSQSWDQAAAGNQEATVTGLSHVISGLTNGVTYVVQVSATTSSGSGAASEVSALVGLPAATPAVAAVGGDSSLLVSWDAAAGNGSNVTGYVVQWRRHYEDFYGSIDEAAAARDASSHVISGLGAHSQYTVRVAAVNAHGQGPFSEEYTAYSGAPGTV